MSDHATIYLIRHPETVSNAEGSCQGRGDSPFSEAGRTQLAQLVRSLRDVSFDAAYTSPLQRARATADEILARRGLRPAPVPELAELDYGELQGTRLDEWPGTLRAQWRSDPWSVNFPGGESLANVRERASAVMRRIAAAHADETVLVSSHGHVNRVLLLELGWRASCDFWHVAQPNASVTVLQLSGDGQ